jgi:DNA mismatch repair ATPase MutS
LLLSQSVGRRAHALIARVAGQGGALVGYAAQLRLVAEAPLQAELLRRLQGELRADDTPADALLARLHRRAGLVIPASSLAYGVVQALTLWDLHLLAAFERWQTAAGRHARRWLGVLGETEALAALAALAHDNPGWVFPDLDPAATALEAQDLGHPLLRGDLRVGNDVTVGPPGTFLLVTGSNMSGKSTLLRAIGVNAVLAEAGGPVCAAACRLPPVAVRTSMHVQDSLERGVSYFMAELQRLKGVVDAAREAAEAGDRRLLYLLDEILQGTNTAERQVAARRIVRHLVAAGAIGAVSTHDLTLADAPQIADLARPIHFSETVSGGGPGPAMTFDYTARPGIATSTNALRLMELVGLDLAAEDAPGVPGAPPQAPGVAASGLPAASASASIPQPDSSGSSGRG